MTDQTSADDVARQIADQFSDNWTTRNFMAARITAALQAERARGEKFEAALQKIADWPDGGNTYGQANIKRFAARTLASAGTAGAEHPDTLGRSIANPARTDERAGTAGNAGVATT